MDRSFLLLWQSCSVGDTAAAAAESEREASAEEATDEVEGEMDASAAAVVDVAEAVTVADMEEGAESRVGMAPAIEVEEP